MQHYKQVTWTSNKDTRLLIAQKNLLIKVRHMKQRTRDSKSNQHVAIYVYMYAFSFLNKFPKELKKNCHCIYVCIHLIITIL